MCVNIYIYMWMYGCMYIYTHTHLTTYIHTYMHACMHAYTHRCIHTYTHRCIHTYIHKPYIYIICGYGGCEAFLHCWKILAPVGIEIQAEFANPGEVFTS